MNLEEFQTLARKTDQREKLDELSHLIPVLGIIGEIGSIASEYKKRIRDGQSYENYKAKLEEEIGDVLWYLANICTDMKLDMAVAAEKNIKKTSERWQELKNFKRIEFYDESFPIPEQFPREMIVDFVTRVDGRVEMQYSNEVLGNTLDDNAYEDDGYRFHDAMHLAFATVLNWSPVLRALLQRKRKSAPDIDNVEDGARAGIIEEAISAIIYNYASKHNFLDGITTIDYSTLSTMKQMVSHLEVSDASTSLWESAILQGFKVFRSLRLNNGGRVKCDLNTRQIYILK